MLEDIRAFYVNGDDYLETVKMEKSKACSMIITLNLTNKNLIHNLR